MVQFLHQRRLARFGADTAADHGGHGGGMVRRAERPPVRELADAGAVGAEVRVEVHGPVGVALEDRSRVAGREEVGAVVVGKAAPAAREVRVEGRVVRVDRMPVAPRGIGLPDFDELSS